QCIAGNVELQLAAGESDCACDFVSGGRCDTFSKEWYPYAQQTLSEDALAWMHRLPEFIRFQYAGKSFFVLHGSYQHTSEFIFRSTDWALKARNFEATQAEVILAGHCGLPFSEEQEGRHWLNAGVIGMPANDGTPRVWYLLLEEGEAGWTYTHRELHYDYQQARQGMIDHALPPTYAETLRTGIWDNCEILPPAETALQGQAIEFREMI
ncbi:MAG: metallophosphoesterase family protein, partial [Phaeodactylibacter sp.]|nr:metallophosphoesterase family protein [Phaeodactylibacter sp.]